MSTHHLITEIPINRTNNLGADGRGNAIKRVPDDIIALTDGNDASLVLSIVPRNYATVCHLTATPWIKNGCVKGYLVAFDSDDLCGALIGEAICMVE